MNCEPISDAAVFDLLSLEIVDAKFGFTYSNVLVNSETHTVEFPLKMSELFIALVTV